MFHAELLSFFALMKRTAESPESPGWKPFTKSTKALVHLMNRKFPGLFEVDDENKLVRLSAEGEILYKWMYFVPPKAPVVEKDEGDDVEE